jgi:hypothetical protein
LPCRQVFKTEVNKKHCASDQCQRVIPAR